MKKVIRLTESDLMRIVKRVINEQEQQQAGDMEITPEVKQYLNINTKDGTLTSNNKTIDAAYLIKKAHLNNQPSYDKGLKNYDIGTTIFKCPGDPNCIKTVEDFQKMETNNKNYFPYLKGIMDRMTKGSIVFRPFNGGKQVGLYGAKYIPSGPFGFILVPCTKQQPCRATDY